MMSVIMLSVIMLSVIMLSVIMLSVIMLSAVAPHKYIGWKISLAYVTSKLVMEKTALQL